MPEEIKTSLYVQTENSDFNIVIRPPVIEYTIPGKNFLFMKTLTREENHEFIQSNFINWQSRAIMVLCRFNKFNELLTIIERGQDYKVV